jgi:hypothetical protein
LELNNIKVNFIVSGVKTPYSVKIPSIKITPSDESGFLTASDVINRVIDEINKPSAESSGDI